MRDQLAKAFHETQSFKWDPERGFKLASGLISPFYVDCRSLMAHPAARRLVAQLAYDALRPVELNCLGGLEIGAISIATTISDFAFVARPSREWRTFVVRKQAKDHGLGKLIEGAVRAGDQAVIVDDVLTSGGSLLKAVAAARSAGLLVTLPPAFETTAVYNPPSATEAFVITRLAEVLPAKTCPSFRHSKVKVPEPVAVTDNAIVSPVAFTVSPGCAVIKGAAIAPMVCVSPCEGALSKPAFEVAVT